MLASAYSTISNSTVSFFCRRNNLFKLSGISGVYPQFFLIFNEEEKIEFLGDWEKIEAVNDASGLPVEILERHPDIMTWEKVMGY
jgi:hypothetical protein